MPTEVVKLDWVQHRQFLMHDRNGFPIVMDQPNGVNAADLLPLSLIGCSSYDMVAILEKQRQKIIDLAVTAESTRDPDPPWTFRKIHVHYKLSGCELDPAKVARAIQLAEEKYCGVFSTLQRTPASSLGLAQTTAVTASDIADELEPEAKPPRAKRASKAKSQTKSKFPLVIDALLVLGGGGVAGVLVLNQRGQGGYTATTRIKGVTLTAGKKFEADNLPVETTGKVSPEAVAAAYRAPLAEILAFEPKVEARRDVVQEIVALPSGELCNPTIGRVSQQPCGVSDTVTTALRGEVRQLLVADDPAALAQNLRIGLAQAVCDFQFLYLDSSRPEEVARAW